jgi:outer membrane protein TolC
MESRDLQPYLFKLVFMFQMLLLSQFSPPNECRAVGTPFFFEKDVLLGTKDSWQEVQLEAPDRPQSTHSPGDKLTLEGAINRALRANRGLANTLDQVESARLTIVSAEAEFELKIFPGAEVGITGAGGEDTDDRIGLGVSLQKRFPVGTDLSIRPLVQKTGDIYETRIDTSLTQPLLQGFGREFNLSGVYGAEFGARSARRGLYLTQVNTVLATIGFVYDVIRQRELVRLNEESAVRLRVHAEAARAKEKIGLATQIDTYRAGIQQKEAEDNLNTAIEAYRAALDNLKVLLALPLEEALEVEAPLEYSLVRLDEAEAVKSALRNRVELDQSADTVREAKRLSRVAKQNTRPNLDLVFNYSRFDSGDTFGDSTGFDKDAWGVSVVTTTDLARTAERVAFEQSLLSVNGARRNDSLQRDEVVREVKRDIRNLRRSEKAIAIQEEQIRQSKGQLELARVKFRWGLADNFDLIDAETQLRTAQTNLLSAVLDYIVGSSRLRATLGTLIERPERF